MKMQYLSLDKLWTVSLPVIITYLSLINRKFLIQGTLYHKGFSYFIQSTTKFEYILCSTLSLGYDLYFRISINGLILVTL